MQLESSKSESNRALIIAALARSERPLHNISDARDTRTMRFLLKSQSDVLDAKDAGTTMRFLVAYLAITGKGQLLTGTERMKQRPIGPLVNALRSIGAKIEYEEQEGYPPLRVHKIEEQKTAEISIPGNISSQYISALLMIAPCLPKGLSIRLTTEVYSRPYIQMTLDVMRHFGVNAKWDTKGIHVKHQAYIPTEYAIEGDWSGASYWYSFAAISRKKGYLNLPGIRTYSSQGDLAISDIMYKMGVTTHFESGKVKLLKRDEKQYNLSLDFKDCPDLAQTVMVAAAASGVTLNMTGLESLKIKETDRIEAMKKELSKLGAMLLESTHKWILKPSDKLPEHVEIDTYDDHRMAMAFAPLCTVMDVTIKDPCVVDKSYPKFWDVVKSLGITIENQP
ncbi:MAG: 3-phosphoshikimate 1-carboxyvinyltransferase [Ekhidna sp.]